MGHPLVREQTPLEYFRSSSKPMTRQHAGRGSTGTTSSTCSVVHPARSYRARRTARARLGRGLERRLEQRARCAASAISRCSCRASLRQPCDEIRRRRLHKSMGEYAYGSLSAPRTKRSPTCSPSSRASSSASWMSADISERTALIDHRSAPLARRAAHRRARDGQRLIERGILQNQSIGGGSSITGAGAWARGSGLGFRFGKSI